MSESNTSASTVLLAMLGGAIVGAGIALLYAPQSGTRTRMKLKDLGEDAEESAREILERALGEVERAGKKGEEWIRRGQDYVDNKVRQAAAAVDGAKNAAVEALK